MGGEEARTWIRQWQSHERTVHQIHTQLFKSYLIFIEIYKVKTRSNKKTVSSKTLRTPLEIQRDCCVLQPFVLQYVVSIFKLFKMLAYN